MDAWLLSLLNQHLAHPLLDAVVPAFSLVGLALCPALGASLLRSPQHRRTGVALLAALAVGLALTLALQWVVLRPRPEAVRLLAAAPNFPSFPSGHAMAGFATATVLGLWARRPWVTGPAVAAALLLALSRVYLGHHYPSDVFAGAVLGAGVGAASYGLCVQPQAGAARWRWLPWPQLALIVVVSQVAYMGRLPLRLLALPYTDKVLHFLLFGSVVFWLNLWLASGAAVRPHRVGPLPVAVVLPFGLALLEEGAQSLSTWRSAGLDDLVADLAGMLLFWLLSERVRRRAAQSNA